MGRKVNRFTRKVSKFERIAEQARVTEYHQKGKGLYVFRNRSQVATLTLPKPAANGDKMIGPHNPKVPGSGEFEGDDYFIENLVKTGDALIVRTIRPPEPGEKQMTNEERLILDQPDRVTNQGPVEQVTTEKPLTEVEGEEVGEVNEVVLIEDPMAGVEIITD